MNLCLFLAVLGGSAVLQMTQQSRAHQSQAVEHSPEVEAFLSVVDVDGDGIHTYGDRAVMEWWIQHGGDVSAVQASAGQASPGQASAGEPIEGVTAGVISVEAFFNSPAAQLDPQEE